MADTFSTHYGWTIPAVGTSAYAPKINADIESIDGDLFAVSEVADQAQSDATAAGTDADTALAQTVEITPSVVVVGGSVSAPTATIDLNSGGPVYRLSATGILLGVDLTITLTNRPATLGRLIYLHVSCAGSGGASVTTKIASGSKQWALPLSGNDVTSTGTQELGVCDSGSQAVYPLYIVAGV